MALPGGPMEICFSFDTNGSMNSCIAQIKDRVQDIARLQADIPEIRIAFIVHGDKPYSICHVTEVLNFTSNVDMVGRFMNKISGTGSKDGDRCSAYILSDAIELPWTPGSKRVLVMIGDADPQTLGYAYLGKMCNDSCLDKIDRLSKMNVRFYGVQYGYCRPFRNFYRKISTAIDGEFLILADPANSMDFMMAICYKEFDKSFLQISKTQNQICSCHFENPAVVNACLLMRSIHGFIDLMKIYRPRTKSLFRTLKGEDVDIMEKIYFTLTKIPSLPNLSPVKLLKPRYVVSTTQSYSLRSTSKTRIGKLKEKSIDERLERYKLNNLPKLKRESVSDKYFMLNDAPWTKWELALVLNIPANHKCDLWIKRKGALTGYRKKRICGGQYNVPALYEFAVQSSKHSKRHVVYCKSSNGFNLNKGSWELQLLNKPYVRQEIENILTKDFRVFVRSFLLMKTSGISDKLKEMNHYNYAWGMSSKKRTTPRPVYFTT